MLKKLVPQNFNDSLCLVLVVMIMAAWILAGMKLLELPAEVTGALIVTWTLLVQFYFRKAKSAAAVSGPAPAGEKSAAEPIQTSKTP